MARINKNINYTLLVKTFIYKQKQHELKARKKHEKTRLLKRTFILIIVFFICYFLGGYLTMPVYNYLGGF